MALLQQRKVSKIKNIIQTNWIKTLRINFHYLPFKSAIKLPILISYGVKFRKIKGGLQIWAPLRFGMIKMGYDTLGLVNWPREKMLFENRGKLVFKGSAVLGAATRLVILPEGEISFGDDVRITGRTSFISEKKIEIGDGSLLSWDIQIMDTDFHKIYTSDNMLCNSPQEIKIGSNVWVGSKATILKGSVLPDNCVVAANALVAKKHSESNVIYGGNPAKIIKTNIHWER